MTTGIQVTGLYAHLQPVGDLTESLDLSLDIKAESSQTIEFPKLFNLPDLSLNLTAYRLKIGDTVDFLRKMTGQQETLEAWSANLNWLGDLLGYYIQQATTLPTTLHNHLTDLNNAVLASVIKLQNSLTQLDTLTATNLQKIKDQTTISLNQITGQSNLPTPSASNAGQFLVISTTGITYSTLTLTTMGELPNA